MDRSPPEPPSSPSRAAGQRLLPIGVFLVGVAMSAALASVVHRQEVARFERAIAGDTERYAADLGQKVELRLLAIERMASRWERQGGMSEAAWVSDVGLYLEHMDGFVAVAWVSPALETRWIVNLPSVVPVTIGTEAASARVDAAGAAAVRQTTTLTEPFPLLSSGTGIASLTPVFVEGRLEGFHQGLFQVEHLITDFARADQLDVVLRAGDEAFPEPDPSLAIDVACAEASVEVRNARWRLRGCPTTDRVEEELTAIPAEVFVAGILLSALVAGLLDRARAARRRTAQVEAVNERLAQTIDELRARQEELRAQQEELAERAAVMEAGRRDLALISQAIAHDLRSPLRAMHGYSRALTDEYGTRLDDTARGYLARIEAGASRMARLLDELLAFARVARAGVNRQPVDVSALARAVGEALAAAEPDRHVELHVQEDLHIEADPGLTRALLEELLDNAWKFTRLTPCPHVEVRLEERDGKRWLFVGDNGVGFDPRWATRLFRPFERLHADATFEGPGMGLAIAWRIAHLHGGDVRIDAREGEGAAVRVRLEP